MPAFKPQALTLLVVVPTYASLPLAIAAALARAATSIPSYVLPRRTGGRVGGASCTVIVVRLSTENGGSVRMQ